MKCSTLPPFFLFVVEEIGEIVIHFIGFVYHVCLAPVLQNKINDPFLQIWAISIALRDSFASPCYRPIISHSCLTYGKVAEMIQRLTSSLYSA